MNYEKSGDKHTLNFAQPFTRRLWDCSGQYTDYTSKNICGGTYTGQHSSFTYPYGPNRTAGLYRDPNTAAADIDLYTGANPGTNEYPYPNTDVFCSGSFRN